MNKMKKLFCLAGVSLCVATLVACSQSVAPEGGKKNDAGKVVTASNSNGELAVSFLRAVQDGNKEKVYQVAGLTTALVDESREKLVHAAQYKLSEGERKEWEHALRMSGEIDFFLAKMKKLLPKSAEMKVVETTTKVLDNKEKIYIHRVKLTYQQQAEAMHDKTGQPVKEMIVNLQQLERSVKGQMLHEFSFSGNDFEKMADKEFEVVSYWK